MNKKNKKINWILALACLVIGIVLTMFFPTNIGKQQILTSVKLSDESSIINQKIEGVTFKPYEVTKLYYKSDLIGILYDDSKIEETITKMYTEELSDELAGYTISLDDDILSIKEETFWMYQNKDEDIINYLYDNKLFGVDAVKIDIIRDDELVDSIYVEKQEDFQAALKRYALNFIDSEVFEKLENDEVIPTLTTYGTQDSSIYIEEKITATNTKAPIDEIMTNQDDIFTFLCYGREYDPVYYTVKEFDTVDGIATQNGLTSKQVVALNEDIKSETQALVPGDLVNIKYFTSPITTVVSQQRYIQEITYAPSPLYVKDESLERGKIIQDVVQSDGYNDTLYTDIYVNGILSGYRKEESVVVVEPVQAVYRVGSMGLIDSGNLNFRFPVDNPGITCRWGCYAGHEGVDFINRYNAWGHVIASESGVISVNSYNYYNGYYYYIDHGNDANGTNWKTYYGHMRTPGWFAVGTEVERGMPIGDIGMTGFASGPHVHFIIIINGVWTDPCEVMNCNLIR